MRLLITFIIISSCSFSAGVSWLFGSNSCANKKANRCDQCLTTSGCKWCIKSNSCSSSCDGEHFDSLEFCPTMRPKFDENLALKFFQLAEVTFTADPEKCLKARGDPWLVTKDMCTEKCDLDTTCRGYIAVSTKYKAMAVAFRGTQGTLQAVAEALNGLGLPSEPFAGGKGYKYFLDAADLFYDEIKAEFQRLLKAYPTYEVWVTGYSLGAAMASITATRLRLDNVVPASQIKMIDFGQPRVSNRDASITHDKLVPYSFRVVHYKDWIPHIPPCIGLDGCENDFGITAFHHLNEVFYDHEDMPLAPDPSKFQVCVGREDQSCSNKFAPFYSLSDHGLYYGGFHNNKIPGCEIATNTCSK